MGEAGEFPCGMAHIKWAGRGEGEARLKLHGCVSLIQPACMLLLYNVIKCLPVAIMTIKINNNSY